MTIRASFIDGTISDRPTALERAEALRLLGKLERSAAMYEIIARDPAAPVAARALLCQICLELGDYSRCLAEARLLAAADPSGAAGDCGRSLVTALSGRIDEGIDELGELLDRHQRYLHGYALRAHLYRLAGHLTEARDTYSAALRLLPSPYQEDAGLRLGRAYALAMLGASRAARADFQRATTLAPEHPMACLVEEVLPHPADGPFFSLAARAVKMVRAAVGGLSTTRLR